MKDFIARQFIFLSEKQKIIGTYDISRRKDAYVNEKRAFMGAKQM